MYTDVQKVRLELKGVDSSIVPDNSDDVFSLVTAITKACAIVDAYIGVNWSVPESVPDLVCQAATDLSVGFVLEWLYSEGVEASVGVWESKIRNVKDMLEKIANGRIEAGLLPKSDDVGGVWVV
jgi:phage gp36-like protein